jgi:hypothetical protein
MVEAVELEINLTPESKAGCRWHCTQVADLEDCRGSPIDLDAFAIGGSGCSGQGGVS